RIPPVATPFRLLPYTPLFRSLAPPTIEERVAAARRHLEMAIDWKGEKLGVFETRRHYTNYFKGIPHFKDYRSKMVTSDEAVHVRSEEHTSELQSRENLVCRLL